MKFDIQKFTRASSFYAENPDKVIFFEELASTSDYAKKIVQAGAVSGDIVIADYQTQGRGRGGKSWFSEAGEGLLFSLVLDPDIDPSLWYRLSLAVGVAVAVTLESSKAEIIKGDVQLKWPNDVYLRGKKIAGILTEISHSKVVVGVGLNVSGKSVIETGTSLLLEGYEVTREEILASLVREIFKWGSLCGEGFSNVVDEYESRCLLMGKEIAMQSMGGEVVGEVVGIDESGYLLLENEGVVSSYPEGRDIQIKKS